MVRVDVSYNDSHINKIILKGHSGYDVIGKDIVCSSISSITITTVNAIILLYGDTVISSVYQDDYLTIDIYIHNEVIDKLLENMISLLKSLEIQYNENIKIKEVS